jgi:hypothetical protein
MGLRFVFDRTAPGKGLRRFRISSFEQLANLACVFRPSFDVPAFDLGYIGEPIKLKSAAEPCYAVVDQLQPNRYCKAFLFFTLPHAS